MNRKRRKYGLMSRKGFSLIEVMITLTVLGIVAAVSAPAFMSLAPNMALKDAAAELYGTLQQAKVLAIRNNRTITVRFDTPGFYYFDIDNNGAFSAGDARVVIGEDLNNNDTLDAGEDFNGNGILDRNYGIRFGAGSAADDWLAAGNGCVQVQSIQFNSRGLATITSAAPPPLPSVASVYIQNQNNISYAVETRVAGSITTRKFNGTVWSN